MDVHAGTSGNSHPIPRMDECIVSLGDVLLLSTFDTNRVHQLLFIDEIDRNKRAFASYYGLFKFSRKPRGLCNALGTFKWNIYVTIMSISWHLPLCTWTILSQNFLWYRRAYIAFAHSTVALTKSWHHIESKERPLFTNGIANLEHTIPQGKLGLADGTTDAIRDLKPSCNLASRNRSSAWATHTGVLPQT